MLIEQYVLNELNHLHHNLLLRKLNATQRVGNSIVYQNSKPYISFCCNDYFGLSKDSIVKQSAIAAIQKYGLGAGASRLITGNHELYKILEDKLAAHSNQEAAAVFTGGYTANIGTISAMMNRYDLIIADKYIHASLIDGAILSKAKLMRFKHNDCNSCEDLLKNYRHQYRNCLIIIDHVYSMHGDIAPVKEIADLAHKYTSWLAIDDAHGFGIVPVPSKPDIYLGTLSKACGSLGGYASSSKNVITYLHNKARTLIYTTALPISVVTGAIIAIDIVKQSFGKPLEAAKIFCKELNMPEPPSNIVSINMPNNQTALSTHKKIAQEGFLVAAIRPPTVPTPILRFAFTVNHKKNDIERLCDVIKSLSLDY